MGENTTIALLTSINQRLQVIINNTSPKNRNPKEQDAKTVSSLHKGDTLKNVSDTASKSDNSDIKIAPMNMKDIVSTLAQMPSAIKAIVGLKSKNLNKFKLTMSIISNSIEEFSQKGDDLVKGGKTLEKIAHSFEIFNSIDLSKIFKQFEKIDKNKSGEAFNRVLKSVISGINTLSEIKEDNFKRLKTLVESLEKSTESFTKLVKGIGIIVASTVGLTIALKVLKPGEILQAFGIIALITTSVGVIAIGLSALDALLNKVIGGDPKNTPFDKMSRLMNSCVLVSYGALGLGLLMSKAGGLETMLYGLAGIAMVMVGIGSLAALVTSLTNKIVKVTPAGDKETESPMSSMIKFMASAVVLTGVCIGLGFLVEKIGFDELLKGIGAIASVVAAMGALALGVAFVGSLIEGADKMMKSVIKFAAWGVGLTVACIVLGQVVKQAGNLLVTGLGAVLGVTIALGAIAIGAAALGKMVGTPTMQKSLNSIILFTAFGTGLAFAAVYLGDLVTEKGGIKNLLFGIGSIGLVMTALTGLSFIVTKADKSVQKALVSMLSLEGLAIGAAAVLWAIAEASGVAAKVGWNNLLQTGMYMGLVFGGLGIAAAALSKNSASFLKGVVAIAAIEGLALGGALIITMVANAAAKIKEVDEGGDQKKSRVLKTIGLMGLVVTEFGVLAAAAGAAMVVVGPGAIALAAVEAVAFASVKLLDSVINLKNKIGNLETEGPILVKTVSTIGLVIDEFKKIVGVGDGKGFLRNIAENTFSSFSSVVLTPLIGVANLMIGLVESTVNLQKKISETDYDPVTTSTLIRQTLNIFNKENLKIPFTNKDANDLRTSIYLLNSIVTPLVNSVIGIGKIARAFSGGVEGTNIIPLLGIKDDGTPIYGQPVNMPVVASSIIAAIEEFAKAAETKIGTLSRKETRNLVRNFKKLSKIIDPVTKFADMISTFASGDKLYITEIDENGKQTKREVDLKGTAEKIVDAINAFTIALDYDKLEELGKRRARKGAEAFGYIMSPIEGFVNSISKIGSVTTDNPDIIGIIGKNGSVREVNIVKVADAISRSIVQFINQIDGVITNKKDSIKNISKNSENFKIVVEQISSMTASISMLDGEKIMKANTSFVGFLDTLKAQATPENTETLQGMSKTVNGLTKKLTDSADKMRISINKLDESILNKSDKRIKALKEIADTMEKISDNSKDMETALTTLLSVLDKLTTLDSSTLRMNTTNLTNALGNVSQSAGGVQTGNNAAGTSYVGLTQQDIINAISQVLNGLTIHGFKVPVGPSMTNTNLWDQAEESPLIIGLADA